MKEFNIKLKKCIHNIQFGLEPTFISKDIKRHDLFLNISHSIASFLDDDSIASNNFSFHDDDNLVESNLNHENFDTNIKINKFLTEYNKMKKRLEKIANLVPSTCYKNHLNYDGGEHIHLSTKILKNENILIPFLKNLHIFFINHPELNWIFNNPFDIYAANSMLKFNLNIARTDKYGNTIKDKRWNGTIFKPGNYKDLFKYFNVNYTNYGRDYPAYYNNLETIEFRLFMMSRDTNEFKVHFNFAISVYNYIYDITKKNEQLSLKYTDHKQLQYIKIEEAKKNALEAFNVLGLDKEDIKFIKKYKFPILKHRYYFPENLI